MLNRKHALALIARLSRTAKYPEANAELIHFAGVLVEASGGDSDRAEKIIEELRRTREFFPPDAAFYAVAANFQEPEIPQYELRKEIICRICDDTGYAPVVRRGLDCAIPCTCERGRKLAHGPAAEPKPSGPQRVTAADLTFVSRRDLAAGEER